MAPWPRLLLRSVGFVLAYGACSVLWAAAPGAPAPRKAADLVLDYGFPPITPAQAKLDAPPGAPATILLEAMMFEQQLGSGNVMHRVHYWRRVKILTPAGIAGWSDWSHSFYGFRRVQTVEARTVLMNGGIVDAKDSIYREMAVGDTGERDVRMIRIAWPKVEVGAILDLYLSWLEDGLPVGRWQIQHDIPVIDSRLILQIPKDLIYNHVGVLLGPNANPLDARHPRGKLLVWSWDNVPARLIEPFPAPSDDSVRSLIFYPASIGDRGAYAEYAPDWAKWARMERDEWQTWWSSRSAACKALAASVARGVEGIPAKAEAIRSALLERVRVGDYELSRRRASPDDVLSAGEGTSGEVAAMAANMMRSLGLETDMVAFRRRSSGKLVKVAPIPSMLDAAMVRVSGNGAPFYVAFDGVTPAGRIPREAAGATVVPLDTKRTGPVDLPELPAADNREQRVTRGAVDRDGTVTAKTIFTLSGQEAAAWRAQLRPLDAAHRTELIEEGMRRYVASLSASPVTVRGLDDLGADIEVEVAWRAEGYGIRAGHRMMLRMAMLARVLPENCAAAERIADLDFGRPKISTDQTVIELPEGAAVAEVPASVESDAAPVGKYSASHARDGRVLTFRRELRIDTARLAPSAWAFVQPWLQANAQSDDVAVVVELP